MNYLCVAIVGLIVGIGFSWQWLCIFALTLAVATGIAGASEGLSIEWVLLRCAANICILELACIVTMLALHVWPSLIRTTRK